jgi:hypothetical protein
MLLELKEKHGSNLLGMIQKSANMLRIRLAANHYGGKAVVNALQFKAMTGLSLSEIETNALERAEKYLSNHVIL